MAGSGCISSCFGVLFPVLLPVPLVFSCVLGGGDLDLDFGFARRKKLCAKEVSALELSSEMEPDHVPSFRIATNWSGVVGSSAMYATSFQRKAFSVFQSSTVSRHIAQSSFFLSPRRYATSPYSLIAKNASSGPQVTILGGPARHPEGVSHD